MKLDREAPQLVLTRPDGSTQIVQAPEWSPKHAWTSFGTFNRETGQWIVDKGFSVEYVPDRAA